MRWIRDQYQDELDIGESAQEVLHELKPLNKATGSPVDADNLKESQDDDGLSFEELRT